MAKTELLITGGAGYIGSHMVKKLMTTKYTPIVIDDLSYGHKAALPKNIIFYQGNIGNRNLLNKIFKKHKIKAIMHFSAFAYVGESVENPKKYYHNNVLNTLELLNTMLDHKINYFIFSSTCATYGNPLTKKINETHAQNPINPYGTTKLIVEKILCDYGIKHINLRYFNAAGADDSAEIGESHNPETHLVPLLLQTIQGKRKSLKVFGTNYATKDGSCIRDYIHVNDLAAAHLLALNKLFRDGKSNSFNLGSENGYSVLEIIKLAEKITGRKANIEYTQRRPGDPAVLVADSRKARSILKWKPGYTIEDIIRTAWNWEQKRKY